MTETNTQTGEFEVASRDVEDMSLEELRAEFRELNEQVDFDVPYEEQEDVWDRRDDVWDELEARSDVDQPECPNCGGQKWGQAPGDPASCSSCGWGASAEVEQSVHDAWREIMTPDPDGGEEAVPWDLTSEV